jgi:MoxR-like ATPase
MPEHVIVDMERRKRIADLDQIYSERLAEIAGPLAAIHAEKRRQAEAGGGPLVADEADRLAILANAAAQDEAVAAIERERREVKALLRAAKSRNELAAIEASLKR